MSKIGDGSLIKSGALGGCVRGMTFCRHGAYFAQRSQSGFPFSRDRAGALAKARAGEIPQRAIVGRRFRYGKGGRR